MDPLIMAIQGMSAKTLRNMMGSMCKEDSRCRNVLTSFVARPGWV
jgi:hypothetical protein